jgi:hypothetical protein
LRLQWHIPEAPNPSSRRDDAAAGTFVFMTPDIAFSYIIIARRETEE